MLLPGVCRGSTVCPGGGRRKDFWRLMDLGFSFLSPYRKMKKVSLCFFSVALDQDKTLTLSLVAFGWQHSVVFCSVSPVTVHSSRILLFLWAHSGHSVLSSVPGHVEKIQSGNRQERSHPLGEVEDPSLTSMKLQANQACPVCRGQSTTAWSQRPVAESAPQKKEEDSYSQVQGKGLLQ